MQHTVIFFPLLVCSHMNYSETLLDNEVSVAFMFFVQVYLKWKPMICYLQKRSSDLSLKKTLSLVHLEMKRADRGSSQMSFDVLPPDLH